ncbi:MAG: ATP-binding protein, partial [Anaerolineae bacterium]
LITAVFIGLWLVPTQAAVFVGGVVVVGTAVLWLIVFNRQVKQPLHTLTESVQAMTGGQSRRHVVAAGAAEIVQLIHALNRMTEEQDGRLQALNREKQRLSLVLTSMADGILITDGAGMVQLVNPAAARLLHTDPAAAIGRAIAEVLRHHQLIDLWQSCQKSGQDETAAIEIGSELFLQAVITPFVEEKSRGFLVILQDLTQIHRLQTVRRDFISNISHELRTPLASLRAVVETLQGGAKDDPPAAERFLSRAEQEVDTLTQMVEELLELSRIESGQVPLQLAETAVLDLLIPPLERLRPFARRGHIELILDLPAGLPPVLADAARIKQVVTNLVHNAIKFTPSGGKITVTAGIADDEETTVAITIRDTGVGIPAADLPRIFERFYKSDRARTRDKGGTGLGLAIARHIVQAHDGRLHAKSKEGKGSVFTFTLPTA